MKLMEYCEGDDIVLGVIWYRNGLIIHRRSLFSIDPSQPVEDEVVPFFVVLLGRTSLKLGLSVVMATSECLGHIFDGILSWRYEEVSQLAITNAKVLRVGHEQ
jgi:hypothetical protein